MSAGAGRARPGVRTRAGGADARASSDTRAAYDDVRGDLYAGTDYGPIVLKKGATRWEGAGLGFPEALIVDLEFVPEQRTLVAATHGLGIFFLTLPPG